MSLAENVLALPEHVSPSQISSWHQCGRRYLLERVIGVEQQPMGHFIGGSAVHDTIQSALTDESPFTFEQVFTGLVDEKGGADAITWRGRKSRAYPNGEDPSFWLAEGPRMVARALEIVSAHEASGYEVIDVEAAYSPEIGGRTFRQRADIVFRGADGIWIVLDWKTGQSEGEFAPFQLAYYALAIQETHGVEIQQIVGQIALLRKSGTDGISTYATHEYVPLAVQFVTDFTAGTQAGVYPMRISALCKACSCRAACDYGKTLDPQGGDE